MKYFVLVLATLVSLAATAVAGPLQKKEVAADAKWLLHLDVEQLRTTSTGDYLLTEFADKIFAKPKAVMKQDAGFDLDLTKIRSVTAYGDYNKSNSVLVLKTDLDVKKALDGALARIMEEGKPESPPVAKTVQGGITTYTLRDHAIVSVRPDGITTLSLSTGANEKANDVLSGKTANLSSGHAFSEFPESRKTFFFLGAAEAFNASRAFDSDSGEGEKNNPKAKILKLSDSGRIIIGQEADQVFLHVSLKAKTSEVVTQMQQVVQGMIALASLAQSDNEDVQQLTGSAKVTTAGNIVNLSLNFPADKALIMLSKHLEQREHGRGPHGATNRHIKKDEK